MGRVETEPLTGAVDGVNVDFETTLAWRPGTLQIFVGGLSISPTLDDDGWIETGPKSIRFGQPPSPGQRLVARYVAR